MVAVPIERDREEAGARRVVYRCRTPDCHGRKLLDVVDDPRNFGQARIQCPRCRNFQTFYLGGYRRMADGEPPT